MSIFGKLYSWFNFDGKDTLTGAEAFYGFGFRSTKKYFNGGRSLGRITRNFSIRFFRVAGSIFRCVFCAAPALA
jgi:hypothetical protein